MITQMKKYTFLVFHRDYEPFLTQLRELGVVHITQKAAGLIEDDEQLQAALQHEDELRRLLKQGAPDQLIAERNEVNERIAAAQEAAKQAAVWGEFDAARVAALKEAGYTLHSYEFDGSAGMAKMNEIMARFHEGIDEIAGFKIDQVEDFSKSLNGLPASDVFKFFTDKGSIVVRPSGTEPKLKVYISVTAENKNAAESIEKKISAALAEQMR